MDNMTTVSSACKRKDEKSEEIYTTRKASITHLFLYLLLSIFVYIRDIYIKSIVIENLETRSTRGSVEVVAEIRHRGSDPGTDTPAGHSISTLGRSTVSFRFDRLKPQFQSKSESESISPEQVSR